MNDTKKAEEKQEEAKNKPLQNIEQSKTTDTTNSPSNSMEPADNDNIGYVGIKNNYVEVYDEGGHLLDDFFCGPDYTICGFNSEYLVIRKGDSAEIYTEDGKLVGKIDAGVGIVDVMPSSVKIKYEGITKYYNFHGDFIRTN